MPVSEPQAISKFGASVTRRSGMNPFYALVETTPLRPSDSIAVNGLHQYIAAPVKLPFKKSAANMEMIERIRFLDIDSVKKQPVFV